MRPVRRRAAPAGALLALAAVLWPGDGTSGGVASAAPAGAAASYVGAAACAGCHPAQTAAWQGSHHAQAMQPANAQTVLGRFDHNHFSDNGITSTFWRKGGNYFVRTDGPDGRLADFPVRYTFGVYPLQQYLVPLPGGRLQALPFAWDARPQAAGGQRWLHLYAGQHLDHRDPLHWSGREQNWNNRCAECHSTHLLRQYDAQQDRYATRWSDLAVACEACHGPGSAHLDWARRDAAARQDDKTLGLGIALDERHGVRWLRDPGSGAPRRSTALASHREVETCAVCHARRRGISADPGPSGRLFDTHDPSLLEAGLYFPDGQQQGEVYEYGSFLQSRMYAQGVSCGDCHEPHGGKLRAQGNALCTQCHDAARYDAGAHHRHAPGSAGAQCVNCHMPTRTYMQVDARRDHSLRVPRPDLSAEYGVPNACNACHQDRDARWAAAALERGGAQTQAGYQQFAAALAGARAGQPGAPRQLLALAGDGSAPGIARATAVMALGRYPGPRSLDALRDAAASPDALLHGAALDALLSFPAQARAALALSLAGDATLDLRAKAGRALAAVPDAALSAPQRAQRQQLFDDYVATELAQADRPEAHFNLGNAYTERGAAQAAEREFRAALRLDPAFVPAYANGSDLYRALGREDQAAAMLRQGLRAVPGDATLLHLLGLQRVRSGDRGAALELLRQAAARAPDNAHFSYVYAVALHDAGQQPSALALLRQALLRSPYDAELLSGAAQFAAEAGDAAQAQQYRQRYAALAGEEAPAQTPR